MWSSLSAWSLIAAVTAGGGPARSWRCRRRSPGNRVRPNRRGCDPRHGSSWSRSSGPRSATGAVWRWPRSFRRRRARRSRPESGRGPARRPGLRRQRRGRLDPWRCPSRELLRRDGSPVDGDRRGLPSIEARAPSAGPRSPSASLRRVAAGSFRYGAPNVLLGPAEGRRLKKPGLCPVISAVRTQDSGRGALPHSAGAGSWN